MRQMEEVGLEGERVREAMATDEERKRQEG